MSEADSQRFIAPLGQLAIAADSETMARALGDTLNLARRYRLLDYDMRIWSSPCGWAFPWRHSMLTL